jgi:hopanoid C-3 methylase
MNIVFVRPCPSPQTIGLQHLMIVEPLELEILASLIEDEHQVEIIDMILEKQSLEDILLRIKPGVVCFTGYITHIPVIIEKARLAKGLFPGVITIVGGVHVEKFPEDIDCDVIDYRVIKNPTRCFPLLIGFLQGKASFPKGVLGKGDKLLQEMLPPEFDFYAPMPNRALTHKYRKHYFYVFHNKVALLKTSFGCPFACNFCFCRQITDGNYFERPLEEVMIELESISEKEIYIVDDDFLLNPARIKDFIAELKIRKLNKRFLVYGRADFIANHPDIIKDFKEVGLRTIIVGLESFKDIELKGFNKKTSNEVNVRALQVMNHYKVDCYAAVILSPDWDFQDFKKAGDVMEELGIKFVNLQPLTPLKGIEMQFDEKRLVIDRQDFARWDLAHVTIEPEKMSLQQYYINILRLYQRIVLNPRHLFSHLKYPLNMQYRMIRGMYLVQKQYKNMIKEFSADA